ncbi:MAG TPA: hypothetical protein VFY29_11195 [Terriglobia bacterium]|nr:hypothetical protein [Terriglobia bacterium]
MAGKGFPPILNEEMALFVTQGVSTYASSVTRDGAPAIGQVLGCRVAPDRRKITLLISRTQFPDLIGAIESSGRIAVGFSHPRKGRAIQLKGRDAMVGDALRGDRRVMETFADAFVEETRFRGFDEALIRSFLWADPSTMAAVTFTPAEAFDQTPGPGAGRSMTSR